MTDSSHVLRLKAPHINEVEYTCIQINDHYFTIVPEGLRQLSKLPIEEKRRRRAESQRAYYWRRKEREQNEQRQRQ